MMLDRIKSQRDACIDVIDKSTYVDDNDKIMYRDLINNAANGTNGLNPEEKLQNVSETVFSLVMLKIMDKCSGISSSNNCNNVNSLYQLIAVCKWPVCVLAAILGAVLIISPELAPLLVQLSGK